MAQVTARTGGVGYVRPEVRALYYCYDLVRDCIAGAHIIKKAGTRYLPKPNPDDDSKSNGTRYGQYILRAVFYNATRRTVFGMIGQIFLRDPVIEAPTSFDVVQLDADGEGINMQQMMMTTCQYVLAYGRAGILVDFPAPEGTKIAPIEQQSSGWGSGVASQTPVYTQQELDEGDVRPIFKVFDSRLITNWRKAVRGSRKVYTLIVVQDWRYIENDGFETKSEQQYIVMRLLTKEQAAIDITSNTMASDVTDYVSVFNDSVNSNPDDVFKYEIWRKNGVQGVQYVQRFYPTDKNGKFLNEIPFFFVGADKNDDQCPEPPVYDLAELNIAHYRNSADYEEAVFITGQPTIVVSGVTMEWGKQMLKNGLAMGARGGIPLPVGGQAQLLQVAANSMPKEAMTQKEQQMVALGAKLVEQRPVQMTATQAAIESTSESTILGNIAKNVGIAWEQAIKAACKYTGDDPTTVSVKLNTEFDLTKMDPAERFELLTEWVNNAISDTEMRSNLRRAGVATLDDAAWKAASDAQKAQAQKEALDNADKMGQIAAKNAPAPAADGTGGPTVKQPLKPKQVGGGKDPNQQNSGS